MDRKEKFTPGPWHCPVCGSTNRTKPTQKYCSRECSRKMNGKKQVKREHWWKNNRGYIEGWCFCFGSWKRKKLHRHIMELFIGRELLDSEDVHHINGDKCDNRIENLELLSHSAHSTRTNFSRVYNSGYTMKLSISERKRRSDWMKRVHVLKKARGEE